MIVVFQAKLGKNLWTDILTTQTRANKLWREDQKEKKRSSNRKRKEEPTWWHEEVDWNIELRQEMGNQGCKYWGTEMKSQLSWKRNKLELRSHQVEEVSDWWEQEGYDWRYSWWGEWAECKDFWGLSERWIMRLRMRVIIKQREEKRDRKRSNRKR